MTMDRLLILSGLQGVLQGNNQASLSHLIGSSCLCSISNSGLSTMVKEVRVFLNLFVESKELEGVTQSLVKLPEVTDVYEVTGEYDIVCMLKVENILAFRNVLKDKVLKINGVRSTVSSVVLYEHKREGKLVSE